MKKLAALVLAGLAGAVLVFFGLAVFLDFTLQGPPRQDHAERVVQVERSTLQLPLRIPMRGVEAALETGLKSSNPLLVGTSEQVLDGLLANWLGADELRERPKQECRMVNVVETITAPMKCGDIIKRPKDFARVIAQCFGASVGRVINVTRTVTTQVEQCTPIKELPISRQKRKINVAYRVEAHSVDLYMRGRELKAQVRLAYDIKMVGKKPRRAPKKKCKPYLIANAVLEVKPQVKEGRLKIAAPVRRLDLDHKQNCPFAGVMKTIVTGLGGVFEKKLKRLATNAIQKKISDQLGGLTQTASFAAHQTLKLPVPFDAWLMANPEKLGVSDLSGVGSGKRNALLLSAGITARPEIYVGAEPQSAEVTPLTFERITGKGAFKLVPKGVVTLDFISQTAAALVNEYVGQNFPDIEYDRLDVEVYQSGDRVVLGVHVKGFSWFNADGSIFLTGAPRFDAARNQVYFADLKFDAESSVFLAKSAAWLFNSQIITFLTDRLRFSLDDRFQSLLTTLKDFRRKEKFGVITGRLGDLTLGDIWLDRNNLNLSVIATGKAQLAIDAGFIAKAQEEL